MRSRFRAREARAHFHYGRRPGAVAARLLTEAQAASLLHSPYIADIYDIGERQGRAYCDGVC